MAYDPNDPKDKAILDAAVTAAVEERNAEFDVERTRLTDKNKELLGKIAKARTDGGGDSVAEISRLETQLEEVNGKLATLQTEHNRVTRELTRTVGERDAAKATAEKENAFSRDLIVRNDLTTALVENNVAPEFLDDVTASLARNVEVREVEGKRNAFVGDKSAADFVKEWATGDKGKHYVRAPANGGTQLPNQAPANGVTLPGAKPISKMNAAERTAHYNTVGQAAFDAQVATERATPAT